MIQSLWIGSELSIMERLSMLSYLQHGHMYHLYTYYDIKHVPEKVVIKDAREILPEEKIREYKHIAHFADFFRYTLLLKKGGWWVDTDTICLKSFDFSDPYVFSSEQTQNNGLTINGAYIKAPVGSDLMEYAFFQCGHKDGGNLRWTEIGSEMLTGLVDLLDLQKYVKPPEVFNPLPWWKWEDLINPAIKWEIPEGAYAIHLWHEMWRRAGKDTDAAYPADCLYEQLKKQLL